ncbi:RagB/SusD family nutrient uptake outer membrane protein [Pedobacter chitinilyticus]|uniref:RagB/SusD family nutrient uptake outer membrane protein n=1 Tax=Pedobacter chitinilyticus TaxID=2233776 RepID=A0A443Z277_9SPHI|nr:RagB/SusD family nutrient uptake outer membrane protein [Pedobacter chitinilyticus]RWU10616.1 RagB/SusD family nutrient uptake outer membrane protein [Pedobacter chitinilyticus]
MKKLNYIIVLCTTLSLLSCEKFLDERSKSNLRIATTVSDFQSLLDNYSVMNYMDLSSAEMVAGDFYLTDADWASRAEQERRLYLWATSNVMDLTTNDWINMYNMVYRANTVIEGTPALHALNSVEWRSVLGQGYYYRAKSFLQLLGSYALAYDEAEENPGIPLRLDTDFNKPSVRASVKQGYQQLVADLHKAIPLLPVTAVHVMRPSKPAAHALLARAYLMMRKYEQAGLHADSCLQLKSNLIDYNTLNLSLTNPFVMFHPETIHYTRFQNPSSLSNIRAKISLEIINSYADGDLRKQAFYRLSNGAYAQRGSYSGETIPFGGLATDEVYLVRAESYARAGRLEAAMDDVNTLLKMRWDKRKSFIPYTANTKEAAINVVLLERRKELTLRGLRWSDIKRLNKEGRGISLSRTINGVTYTLPANSARFANPIPEGVINASGMAQNQY